MTQDSTSKRRTLNALKEHMTQVADSLKVSRPQMTADCTNHMSVSAVEHINERELTSIYALLAYVSYNQNVQQETVQMILETEMEVDHIAKIRRKDYMRAVEFLVDVRMDEIIN